MVSDGLGGSDPVALIPGDPDALDQMARQLASWGGSLELAAEGLSRIDTTAGWSGQAAEAFRKVFDNQPGKWKNAADAFREASEALGQYAVELRWAQQQASAALTAWHSGDHQGAQRTLENARSRLSDAASTAARAVGTAADTAPPRPGLLSEIGHGFEDAVSSAWHGVVQAGEDTAGAIASYGNAAIHDPGALAAMAGGALLTAAGAAGEFGGVVLDLSVVGAPAGVAVNAGSAAAMVGGLTMAGAGLTAMAMDANDPDRVNVGQSGSSGGGNDEVMEPELDPKGEQYIKGKHFAGGSNTNDAKGIFDNDADLNDIVDISKGTSPVGPNPDGFYERTFNTGKLIGTTARDYGGHATSWVTLVQDKYGGVITMYPVPPGG